MPVPQSKRKRVIFEVTIPLPRTDVNHMPAKWYAKAAIVKHDRETAREETMVAVSKLKNWKSFKFPWKRPRIHVIWYHRTDKLHDTWNIVGNLKATIDGIRMAGIMVDDDEIQPPTVERLIDRENPRVTLIFTKFTKG